MPDLKPDCGACAGLCCMAFAFEAGADFACDKPAGIACPHLTPDDGCAIHGDRTRLGFAGCVAFDCQGAGQRVTQDLFGGRHWRDAPALVGPMIAAFRAMRSVHRSRDLLELAGRLPLSLAEAAERQALLALLEPEAGWSAALLADFEAGPVPSQVQAFLASLKDRAGSIADRTPA